MKSQVNTRRIGVVAVAACGLVALSACSSGSSTGASSSATRSTSTTSSAATSSAMSTSSAATSSTAASPTATTPTSTKPPADPIGACTTANAKSNAAIAQWNAAVSSQSKSKLDAAAHNFEATATSLRTLPAKAADAGFTSRVKAVAADLDAMAKSRFAGITVDPSTYNSDSEKLRSYCQALITKK